MASPWSPVSDFFLTGRSKVRTFHLAYQPCVYKNFLLWWMMKKVSYFGKVQIKQCKKYQDTKDIYIFLLKVAQINIFILTIGLITVSKPKMSNLSWQTQRELWSNTAVSHEVVCLYIMSSVHGYLCLNVCAFPFLSLINIYSLSAGLCRVVVAVTVACVFSKSTFQNKWLRAACSFKKNEKYKFSFNFILA